MLKIIVKKAQWNRGKFYTKIGAIRINTGRYNYAFYQMFVS